MSNCNKYIATIRFLELDISLEPSQVFLLSQDNNACIVVGLTTADPKTRYALPKLSYRVIELDRKWMRDAVCKLIPAIYAGMTIENVSQGGLKEIKHGGSIGIRNGNMAMIQQEEFASLFTQLSLKDIIR